MDFTKIRSYLEREVERRNAFQGAVDLLKEFDTAHANLGAERKEAERLKSENENGRQDRAAFAQSFKAYQEECNRYRQEQGEAKHELDKSIMGLKKELAALTASVAEKRGELDALNKKFEGASQRLREIEGLVRN